MTDSTDSPRRKVLLIGWDAADWKVINPLLDAGKMPALERLVDNGVIGNIATMDPPLSPMLWTSIATGKTADQHGVLGFVQPNASGDAVGPVLGSTRKVKALWNILMQKGMRSNVVSWWPSHPADPIDGVMVSNLFQYAKGTSWEEWPPPPGGVHPPELSETLAQYRVHPGELTGAQLTPFLPAFRGKTMEEMTEEEHKRTTSVAKILAECTTTHAITTWLLENTEWDFTATYFDAIDHFSHGFMRFHPPQMPYVSDEAFEKYQHVIESGYLYHDMMLDRLLTLAGPETTVILVSDHGFHSDHLRLKTLPKEPAAPAYEHRDYGVFIASGPGIRKDERVYGASLLDVAPTILSLFGLPADKEMRGRVLTEIYETPPSLERIENWEDVPGESGKQSPENEVWNKGEAETEAFKQLVELGYIDDVPHGKGREYVDGIRRESQYYLARALKSTGRPEKAIPILEKVTAEAPDEDRYALRLVSCYMQTGDVANARKTLDAYEERLRSRMEEKGQERPTPGLDFQKGILALAEGDTQEALRLLEGAFEADPHFPELHRRLGEVYIRAKMWEKAEAAYRKALSLDGDNPQVLQGLALSVLRQDQYEMAAEYALGAIALNYFNPSAHAHLGEALMRLGQFERAAQAFEMAVRQEPGIRRVHVWLSEIYRMHLDDPIKATYHLRFASESIAPAASGEAA